MSKVYVPSSGCTKGHQGGDLHVMLLNHCNTEPNSELLTVRIMTPFLSPSESVYLVEEFRKQQPRAPELPPAVISPPPKIIYPTQESIAIQVFQGYPAKQESRKYLPPTELPPEIIVVSPSAAPKNPSVQPTLPKFNRSMVLHAFLTVFRADYTEQYSVWYDAKTGAARVEYHEGATSCYRMPMSNDRVKLSEMHNDRTGEEDSIVCGVTRPIQATNEYRHTPGLPDTEGFTFAGNKQEFGIEAEVWKRDIQGCPGALGAARGEALLYHHELLVHRREDGFIVPLRYTVQIDSSVLGPKCDGYEHIYSSYQEQELNKDEFRFSDRQCDVKETLDPNNLEDWARLDPIREFTLLTRAPVHDVVYVNYTNEFDRTYADFKEEAVRKNLLTQRSRFINSCNREGAPFGVGHNLVSDRLDVEVKARSGAAFPAESKKDKPRPPLFKGENVDTSKLPKEWNWRTKGAVSPVKEQTARCSSCWAFAVAGSVEGALFIKTKKLVELSVQALVDCSRSHDAHGCDKRGTWPIHAFDYVRDRGIPAVGDYAAYDAKDHNCKAPPSEPTTHIEESVFIEPNNTNAFKWAIRYEAPAVVVVDSLAQSFRQYKAGVLVDARCNKHKAGLNHAVLAIGWGKHGLQYFLIKNSWGSTWGVNGFVRLHAPTNACGVLTEPSFAKLRRPNIDKLPAGASDTDFDGNRT
ncbi:papain family cysteine protease domain-containing protein [Phthorimaea operculella]|nr:papain family cysteine protease domain-containing protein [Phthorimaea operculella]